MEHPVEPTPSLLKLGDNAVDVVGHGHVQLQHVRGRGQVLGHPLCE